MLTSEHAGALILMYKLEDSAEISLMEESLTINVAFGGSKRPAVHASLHVMKLVSELAYDHIYYLLHVSVLPPFIDNSKDIDNININIMM